MAFIEINRLTKNFGAFCALNCVDIEVGEQEFVTFLGPSGCGKTTTLRILAGFLAPDEGTVSVGGAVLSSAESVVPPERRRMGMVFQNYAVWPHMSVFGNVAFGLKYAGVRGPQMRERVARVLDAVGLGGLEDRHPGQLSGGQQQRVALARSLVVEPSILLLDEPLSNLDAKLRERMRWELKGLQRRTGITFVYVTHDQQEAMALSDRIAVFRNGTVQQVGSPRDIYERPANVFVADFMGQVNKLPATLVERRGDTAILSVGKHILRAMASPTLDVGSGSIIAVVRPESLAIEGTQPDPSVEINKLEGTVVDATFLGNLIDYRVDIGGLQIRVQGSRQYPRAIGARLDLTLPVSECVVMRDDMEPADGAPAAERE